ncbi:hypothetical protein C2G38_2029021 [Gigaspora rosea]|uniref:Uncharacterized protein n=1 Tax=Gigaspora rosea TaxID=44941 RepID=A0A397W0Z8_9GLOM|nr:hypothetical protein C2G38_2029021 [Gigaspora rosea]
MIYQSLQSMMSTTVFQIYIDLNTLNLFPVLPTLCPFEEESDLIMKAGIGHRYIIRAVSMGDRIESLVYAFCLGALITTFSPRQLTVLQRAMTQHYYISSIRLYQLFAPLGVEQLYCTTWTTLTKIHCLTTAEYEALLDE